MDLVLKAPLQEKETDNEARVLSISRVSVISLKYQQLADRRRRQYLGLLGREARENKARSERVVEELARRRPEDSSRYVSYSRLVRCGGSKGLSIDMGPLLEGESI